MKLTTFNPFLSQFTAFAALLAAPLAHAVDGTWVGNANWWSDPAGWASSQIATGTDGTANFTGVNITGDINKPLGGVGDNRTIGNITFTDATTASHNLTLSGNILTLDVTTGSPQINVTNQTLTISSEVAGSDGLTKIGGGGLTLSGNNSYTGVTAINTGIMTISHANALGNTAVGSHTTIAATGSSSSGGILNLSGGITTAENITITGATETSGYTPAIGGSGTLSGTITLSSLTNGVRMGGVTFSGTIQQTGSSQSLTLVGTTVNNAINNNGGTLTIYGSTASVLRGVSGSGIGSTGIAQNGVLQLGVTNALNTANELNIGSYGTENGTFNLASYDQTVRGLISSSTSASTGRTVINSVASTTSTLTVGNGGGIYAFSGRILNNAGTGGTVALVKTGAGNQTLSGNNTYTGGTRIDDGILTLGHATDTLANGGAINVNGGTLALGANSDTVGAVTLTSGSITSSTGVLTGSSYAVQSGSVSAILGGAGIGLTKTTGGTVTLTGVNTYSGATLITGGTLSIGTVATPTGSINNSAVTVNGGTFRYNSTVAYSGTLTFTSGTISGTNLTGSLGAQTIGAGQTLSPGNSPGTATTTTQTWANGGSYLWEVNNAAGTAGADPGWDLETGSGALTITAAFGSQFNLLLTSLSLANVAGFATNFNSASNYNWLIADFASVTGFAADAFNINTTNFQNTFTGNFGVALGNTGGIGGDSSQIYLTYTAIPEPNVSALFGSLGLLALLRRRRN